MSESSNNILDVDLADFDREVIEASHEGAVLVDFWADWCPPCLALAPVLSRVVDEYEGQVRLAKVEVDEGDNMKLAGRYQARGFPTVLMFVDGEVVGRFTSAKPAGFIREFIDERLPA
jgi:thioredoxin 1